MRKGMEPRRRRPPQETVVELVETTFSKRLEVGAKHRTEWRNTRLARSVAASLMRPGEKNAYNGKDDLSELCKMSYNLEFLHDLYDTSPR